MTDEEIPTDTDELTESVFDDLEDVTTDLADALDDEAPATAGFLRSIADDVEEAREMWRNGE